MTLVNTLKFPQGCCIQVISTDKNLYFDGPTKDYEYGSGIQAFSLAPRYPRPSMFQGLAQWAVRDSHSDVLPPISLSS
jgi:hypothetical protein